MSASWTRLYVPQQGPTLGAKVIINGRENIPQPAVVGYEPPTMVGRSLRGKPYYQGLPTLVCRWRAIDMDGFQAISSEFFPILNDPDGPVVTIQWHSPYEAGRLVEARTYMEWPRWGEWSEL